MKPRIAVLADVQNIYYTTRQAYHRQFDYAKCWQQIESTGEIVTANAYAIAREDEGQKKFQQALRCIGFDIKLKPYIQRSDGSAKGDWDVGITVDAMQAATQIDRLVLLSGDGDFDLLLENLREKHAIHCTVYGVPTLTAQSLIEAADAFHPIDTKLLR